VASPAAIQIPFKGTFDATATVLTGDRCPELTVVIQGTGKATHLGRLTTDQSHCATPTSVAFTDGLFTFTAANGDQLRGTYSGDPSAPTRRSAGDEDASAHLPAAVPGGHPRLFQNSVLTCTMKFLPGSSA
jgi:hypothetical protein